MSNEELNELKRTRAKIAKAAQIGDLDIIGWAEIGVAAEAIDKQIPEKPEMKAMKGFDPEVAAELCCPTCGGPVTNYWVRGAYPKHCQFCGQAIDWGKEGANT